MASSRTSRLAAHVWSDERVPALVQFVEATAVRGNVPSVIAAIDKFAYSKKWLMNVGDVKGVILDQAVQRARPALVLELGTYLGYSALRMSQFLAPGGRILSVEFDPTNAAAARRVIAFAGAHDKIRVVDGHLGDGGATRGKLGELGLTTQNPCDFVFLDHAKEAYLPDLLQLLEFGLLKPRALVVADNVLFPGVPDYHAFTKVVEGKLFHTTQHDTTLEYKPQVKDIVLVSEYLGPQ
jgi:catechol O-methyltransferase